MNTFSQLGDKTKLAVVVSSLFLVVVSFVLLVLGGNMDIGDLHADVLETVEHAAPHAPL